MPRKMKLGFKKKKEEPLPEPVPEVPKEPEMVEQPPQELEVQSVPPQQAPAPQPQPVQPQVPEEVNVEEAVDEIIVVTNAELPAVTDALKTIRMAQEHNIKINGIIVNKYQGHPHELKTHEID